MLSTSYGSLQRHNKECFAPASSSKGTLRSCVEFTDPFSPMSARSPDWSVRNGSVSGVELPDSPELANSDYHAYSQSTLPTPVNSSPVAPISKGFGMQPSLYPYLAPMTVVAPQEGEPITSTIGPFTVSMPLPESVGTCNPSMSPVRCLITPLGENKIISYYELSPMARVIKQIEDINKQLLYYFSEENLPRDPFLRDRMDPEGFVDIDTFLQFPRIVSMTRDLPNRLQKLVVLVNAFKCSEPDVFEIRHNSKVRLRVSWDRWVQKYS
ncbi:AAR182Cp [Eremothecium gossypii ATCC 10895]|uniref:AAR182Cp n=1 Tax=Eremothecium gossypii (strain ATCC 10895 / CBS 109.51 / FGSC 9923 / NRRL Y-1056) TaxID=284811 RepID=Q75ED4_EREGS|nr:AAR182Cp [Eremothecium gossypii ATCC 10895]AAS50549.1 AAR182Cp [Eremothecium gossypii ATCC 10895]AEY94836.1 FAAR182Cp [Eremothecium gossypii FDAG1]